MFKKMLIVVFKYATQKYFVKAETKHAETNETRYGSVFVAFYNKNGVSYTPFFRR